LVFGLLLPVGGMKIDFCPGSEHFGYHSRGMPALYVKLGGNFATALAVRVSKIGRLGCARVKSIGIPSY